VPTFLSTEWITALAAAMADARLPAHDPFTPFALRQTVTGAPGGGEVDYRVTFSDDGIRVAAGTDESDPSGDLVVTTDYATAVALNRGELAAQEALESGRLEVRGRLDRVTGVRKMLVALDDAARELRATTTYDPVP